MFMVLCVTVLCQVSADSVIKTTGGDVSIKRLVGTTIDVDTSGGDIYIGSLYGNGKYLLDIEKRSTFSVMMSFLLTIVALVEIVGHKA